MSGVLVDTSAWVEVFRKNRSPVVELAEGLLRRGLVCTNGLIRAELLSASLW